MPAFRKSGLLACVVTVSLMMLVFVPASAKAQTATSTIGSGVATVNVLLNYGNGTSVWYNNTSVPSNSNFYNVTTLVTNGNFGAVFFASFGSHFVYAIKGVGCPASNIFCDEAWGFWTLNGICWDLPSLGVDQILVSQAKTVAWFLNPVATFGNSPPTGKNCLSVNLEVKPGSNSTTVNVAARGSIPVAILSAASFDATTVNPASVRFGTTGTEASPVHWSFEDVNGDGRLDLVLQFKLQSTGIQPGDTQVTLMGRTGDGTPFRGFATILAVNS